MSSASIHSLAEGCPARQESAAWARFSAPADLAEFCSAWLAILCTQVDRAQGALVLLRADGQGNYAPVASWPAPTQNLVHLGPTAQRTLELRRGVVAEGASPRTALPATLIGYPVEVDGSLEGAVVLEMAPRPEAEVQRVMRLLHWGSAWLTDRVRQQAVARQQQRGDRLALASEVVATALQEPALRAAALAVANALAARLGCERVGIGLARGGGCAVEAISHTSTFDRRSDFVRLLADAMDEVLDLDQPLVHPPLDADAVGGLAHGALCEARGGACALSVPLCDDREPIGVLTLERPAGRAFTRDDLALGETVGQLLGPVFRDAPARGARAVAPRRRRACGAPPRCCSGRAIRALKLVTVLALVAATAMALATCPIASRPRW